MSRLSAQAAFAIAIGLLGACAVMVYSALSNFSESQRMVVHTLQLQGKLGETESTIATAARARLSFVFSGNPDDLRQYETAVGRIRPSLAELRQLSHDNPTQQKNCDRLEALVGERIQIWEKSIALKKSGVAEVPGQPNLTRQSVAFADETINVTHAMRDEESRLLQGRQASSLAQFAFARVVLVISFLSAIILLFWHYRLLRQELRGREEAEKTATAGALLAIEAERNAHASERSALASQEAARRLNARLLQLRDEERRRFSRELHDSIGQYLAAAKMILSTLASAHADDKRYPECLNLLDQSLTEIRTISHLLHPPGLDEAGFASAARWYAEGFAKRSGLNLKTSISDPPQRMPREIEIALFRVVQESLINIHRHSKGGSAELTFAATPERALLNIKDDGVGIPADVLHRFESSGTSGVGLAGMRERIRELGGEFKVESRGGTSVEVTLPLTAPRSIAADVSGAN